MAMMDEQSGAKRTAKGRNGRQVLDFKELASVIS
jgi:hypothetical protein